MPPFGSRREEEEDPGGGERKPAETRGQGSVRLSQRGCKARLLCDVWKDAEGGGQATRVRWVSALEKC